MADRLVGLTSIEPSARQAKLSHLRSSGFSRLSGLQPFPPDGEQDGEDNRPQK